jgi:hypothetical protein
MTGKESTAERGLFSLLVIILMHILQTRPLVEKMAESYQVIQILTIPIKTNGARLAAYKIIL